METSPRVDAVPSQRGNSRPNKRPTPKSKVHKEKRGVSKKLWNEIVQVFEEHFHWGVIRKHALVLSPLPSLLLKSLPVHVFNSIDSLNEPFNQSR